MGCNAGPYFRAAPAAKYVSTCADLSGWIPKKKLVFVSGKLLGPTPIFSAATASGITTVGTVSAAAKTLPTTPTRER
jgi:hypothetical protein